MLLKIKSSGKKLKEDKQKHEKKKLYRGKTE